MISMVVYSKENKEINDIRRIVKDIIPMISEEKWNLHFLGTIDALRNCMEKMRTADILIFDITGPHALEELVNLRREDMEAVLMIIADTSISPMSYMKPNIKAASLLLRPVNEESMQSVLKEFLVDFIEQREGENPENIFKLETKGEIQYVPYDKIYYFEARKRKLYLRTLNEEYQFVNTVDNLEQILGDQFIRCHRSFIVNSRKIVSITLSDNVINLTNDLVVPLSRGYRSSVKNIMMSRKQ